MQFFYPELLSPDWIKEDGAHIDRLVVHCWAEWNGYDIQMHKDLVLAQKSLSQMGAQIRSMNFDDEAFWPLLKELKISTVPTLILFSKGTHTKTLVGCRKPENIVNHVVNIHQIDMIKSQQSSI